MNLNKKEINRLSYLLGKSTHLILDEKERVELFNLIAKEQPNCPLSFDEIHKLGLIIVGTYQLMTIYEEYNKPKSSENEYIVIDQELDIAKFNLDEKELLNMADHDYIFLRLNNGKIEYADVSYPNKEINNVIKQITKITWKEPELSEV